MDHTVIILFGLKHSGKSTLGKELASKLGWAFADTDHEIERVEGMSVRDLYNKKGANAFLIAEEAACKRLAAYAISKKIIISTGGGICDNPPALLHLKAVGRFVFLENDLKTSVERIVKKIGVNERGGFEGVPAFILNQNPQSIDDIKKMLCTKFTERAELYKKICDLTVKIPNASIEENTNTLYDAVTSGLLIEN